MKAQRRGVTKRILRHSVEVPSRAQQTSSSMQRKVVSDSFELQGNDLKNRLNTTRKTQVRYSTYQMQPGNSPARQQNLVDDFETSFWQNMSVNMHADTNAQPEEESYDPGKAELLRRKIEISRRANTGKLATVVDR